MPRAAMGSHGHVVTGREVGVSGSRAPAHITAPVAKQARTTLDTGAWGHCGCFAGTF